MLIVGKKDSDNDDMDMKKDEYKDEDMEKDALEYCAKSLMKAIQHEDTEKFLKSFKKLIHLSESHMKDDDNDDY